MLVAPMLRFFPLLSSLGAVVPVIVMVSEAANDPGLALCALVFASPARRPA